jgi:large-conductance mechanosensitive channel
MLELLPWLGFGINFLVIAFFAGTLVHRVKALETRMNSKSSKDDNRDEVLTQIRVDIAAIKETLLNRSKLSLW